MKRAYLITIILFFSLTGLGAPAIQDNPKLNQAVQVMSLLDQPFVKQKFCAKKGYIGYQNALGAVYLAGNHAVKVNAVKSYAWTFVAYHQILKTDNKKLIAGQQKTLQFVVEKTKLSSAQKTKAELMANKIIKKHEKSWPNPSLMLKMKDFPAPCSIGFVGIYKP